MASTVATDRMSELLPRMTSMGTPRSEFELVPQRRQRPLDVDVGERPRQPDVIGRRQRAILHEPGAVRGREPPLRRDQRKLRGEQAAQNLGAVGKTARRRQLADIALQPHQPLQLDHRADIVQHGAGDRGRMRHAHEHGQKPAPRTADEDRRPHAERGQNRRHVGELDREIIVFRIAVVVGLAATAQIDGDDATRQRHIVRQGRRQRVEIAHGARQSRQADDRNAGRGAATVLLHMQAQTVLRGDKEAPAIASAVRHIKSAPRQPQRPQTSAAPI